MRSVNSTLSDNDIVYDAMLIFPSISLKKPTPGIAEIMMDAIARAKTMNQIPFSGRGGANIPKEAISIITGRAIITYEALWPRHATQITLQRHS